MSVGVPSDMWQGVNGHCHCCRATTRPKASPLQVAGAPKTPHCHTYTRGTPAGYLDGCVTVPGGSYPTHPSAVSTSPCWRTPLALPETLSPKHNRKNNRNTCITATQHGALRRLRVGSKCVWVYVHWGTQGRNLNRQPVDNAGRYSTELESLPALRTA